MISARELSRLHFLFDNDHPDHVWATTIAIVRKINPDYDFTRLSRVFNDFIDVFYGDYPGYKQIDTPYHDMRHSMDVYMCALRILHGMHLVDRYVTDDEITLVATAALAHDIGYAQTDDDNEGSGAKYTRTHVNRGIAFMRTYMAESAWHPSWAEDMETAILCTNPAIPFADIEFSSERAKQLARVVGTADLVGQMADRAYLEKLLFLYFEFKEANMGDFKDMHDLLRRTHDFYAMTRQKLDGGLGSYYDYLVPHFKDWFNLEHNYYMVSVEKNIEYLLKVIAESTSYNLFDNLKRRGIADKAAALVS
ncbi:MAG: HD domain-containing protein [Methylophilales bacterium]|nr:HD domain-containing protein [Methylophilales bacterium]